MYFVGTELSNPWYENAYLIKELDGNEFLSENYLCFGKKTNGTTVLSFRHSEILKIPEELFDRQAGNISFNLVEYFTDLNQFASGKSFTVNYRVEGKKVTLSVPTD